MLNFTLGASLFRDLEYRECTGSTDENTPIVSEDAVMIKGMRLKGQLKYTHSEDGDSTTTSIVYKTLTEVKPFSLLEGREVMECVPLSMSNGYKVYVK